MASVYHSTIHAEISSAPPAFPLLAREIGAFAYMRGRATFAPPVALPFNGNGQHVMVLPGFMASDATTGRLRRSLDAAGFHSHGWGLGRNFGVQSDIFERIDCRIDEMGLSEKITLVGWSLGGVVAREYAKISPHRIAKVITLGSPFSAHPRANNAWRMYEMVSGYKVDAPPVDVVLNEKPPVPTVAFWSRKDGVVAPASACGAKGEADYHIELECSHMAYMADPDAIHAIGKAIIA